MMSADGNELNEALGYNPVSSTPKVVNEVVSMMLVLDLLLRHQSGWPTLSLLTTLGTRVVNKHNANTSGNKKKNVEPTKEVSVSNSFDMLNLVKNDVKLGTNWGTSHLASQEANYSRSLFWIVDSSSPSSTPIIEKIDKMEKLIIDGKVTLVDNEERPLKRLMMIVRMRLLQLIMKWLVSWLKRIAYEYDPYDDDMYEGQEIPEKLQAFCDNLNIKVKGRKKK
nr:hypothetical protein [Tanacetum cinerariifolium]